MSNYSSIRRIDDLGRIVIPKEYRNLLKIQENDTIEMKYIDNKIVISKYSKILEEKEYAEKICNFIKETTNIKCEISDKQNIIASSEEEFINKDINLFKEEIQNRISKEYSDKIVYPIIINSDIFGLLFLYGNNKELLNVVYKMIIELFTNRIYI